MGVLVVAIAFTIRFWLPKRVIVQPYQRGLLLSKGALQRTVDPGLYRVFPWQQMLLVDTRTQILQVAGQEVLTQDGIPSSSASSASMPSTIPNAASSRPCNPP